MRYENLGRALALTGEFSRADQLYSTAVSVFRSAIKDLPSMTENYGRRLQRALQEYAQVKDVNSRTMQPLIFASKQLKLDREFVRSRLTPLRTVNLR